MAWLSAMFEGAGAGAAAAGAGAAGGAAAGAGAAGAAAGGAGAGAGIGAGLSTIGGTGVVPAAAPATVGSVAGFNPSNYLAGSATSAAPGAAGLLSRLYGPIGAGLRAANAGLDKRGAGSPYEALGNAIGGEKGAAVGRTVGGISSLSGPSQPAQPGRPIYPQRPQLAPPAQSPMLGGGQGGSSFVVDQGGFIAHPPSALAPGSGGLPIRVGY